MHFLILFQIVCFVAIQHILAVFGQKPKPVNLCPKDFLRIHRKCYYFSSEYETWNKARWKCEERNSTLAVINNKNQNNALREFLRKGYTADVPRWMAGQYDWKSFQWKWGYNGKTIHFSGFNKDSIKNESMEWRCLTIDPSNNYSWKSHDCWEKNYFICQTRVSHQRNETSNITANTTRNDTIQHDNNLKNNSSEQHDTQPGFYVVSAGDGTLSKDIQRMKRPKQKFLCPKNYVLVRKKCYFLSRDKASWQKAYFKCRDMKSELVILKTVKQDKRLRTKVNKFQLSNEKRWIGGFFDWKSNRWIWGNSGATLPMEPHSLDHSAWTCAVWDPTVNERWTSNNCLIPMYYMCQRPAKAADKTFKKKKARQLQSTTKTRRSS